MATTLKAILRVEISNAGTTSAAHTVTAEAYERIEVTVPAESGGTAGSTTVEVQPGAAGQVQLVFITANAYPQAADGSAQLTYAVDGGSDIVLDTPLLVFGGAIRALLGSVRQIVFSNNSATDVNAVIVVGRDATPRPDVRARSAAPDPALRDEAGHHAR